jgi:2,4-dienoyl-CoA reductase-like NADH-dependent reductase (Old Yellow Enzyme family)
MTRLFDPIRVGNLELANRIIMAPMTRSRADDEGIQPPFAAQYYGQRASAGLIITEATNISPMARGYIRTPGIYTEDQIESWRPVTESVHSRGGKIFLQIFHTGRIAPPDFLPNLTQPVAPSAVRAKGQNYTDEGMKEFVRPREITRAEISQTVRDFGTAATNAIAAGFDGVELHAASGYIVQQFLSTNANLRSDEYGGSIENRARLLLEVTQAVVEVWGADRVGMHLNLRSDSHSISDSNPGETFTHVGRELGKRQVFVEIILDELGHPPESAPGENAAGRRGSPQAGGGCERSAGLFRRQCTHSTLPRMAGAQLRVLVSVSE